MVLTLTGGNSYALKRRLDELASKFVAEQGELALQRIDASETEPQTIIEAVQSLPFLASRKMVVLRQPSENKTAAEQIEQIISSTVESTDLIIHEPLPDKRTAYFKVLKNKTELEEYNDLDNRELANWLTDEAKNQGGELGYSDANYLVERVGASQQMLANELDKLLTYESKITRENIDLLTEPAPQSKIFELLDAAFSGDKKRALKLYDEQRVQKVEPQQILAMLAWQLQLVALAKHSAGKTAVQIAKDSGNSPYPVEKARALASKLSTGELKTMVSTALDIDYKSKTVALDLDEALKTYIVTL